LMGKTEKQLADLISKQLNLKIRTGREFVQLLLEKVREDLKETGRSELRGLGIFAVHTRPARDTTHPKTGQPVHIKERKAIRYRASKELKELINAPPPEPPKKRRLPKKRAAEHPIESDG
jgi:nucleoid DNA-binding protein